MFDDPGNYGGVDVTDFPPPDTTSESLALYEMEMGGEFDGWFKNIVASMFGGVDIWFETPASTAGYAWQVIQDIKANRLPEFAGNQGADLQTIATNPSVQAYIFQQFIGRLQAANSAQLIGLKTTIRIYNQTLNDRVTNTYRHVDEVAHLLDAEIKSAIAGESIQRKATEAGLLRTIKAQIDGLEENLKGYITNQVIIPVENEFVNQHRQITNETHLIVDQSKTQILESLLPSIAAILAAQAAMTSQLNALQQESDECTKPMCETMGPNTPLGKLIKGIEWAQWIALFELLQNMSIKQLEQLAATIGGYAGNVGDLVTKFVLDALEEG